LSACPGGSQKAHAVAADTPIAVPESETSLFQNCFVATLNTTMTRGVTAKKRMVAMARKFTVQLVPMEVLTS
jgi:hypothetical protein